MKKFIYLALLATTMSFATTEDSVKNTASKIEKSADGMTGSVADIAKTASEAKDGLKQPYADSKGFLINLYDDLKSVGVEGKDAMGKLVDVVSDVSHSTWDLLVKQQLIWSICFLCITLSSIFLGYKFFTQVNKTSSDLDDIGDLKSVNILLSVIYGLLFSAAAVTSAHNFEPMVTGFMNPEFGALRTLIELASKIKQ